MKFLADENIPEDFINALKSAGFVVDSAREKYRSYSDINLIRLVENSDVVIITEDKDFGEWVFSYKIETISVIFLRYDKIDYPVKLIIP